MINVELLVLPKIKDPTIFTIKTTLSKLKWGKRLLELNRGMLFTFKGKFVSKDELWDWLNQTNYFFNPNKHICRIVANFYEPRPFDFWTRIIISPLDEKCEVLRCRGEEVFDIHRAEVYFAKWRCKSETQALMWAEKITRTKSRQSGLLANEHLQKWSIYPGR